MKCSSIACLMEQIWKGLQIPSASFCPNSCSVFPFGVAVNAKNDKFLCIPCAANSSKSLSSSSLRFLSSSSSISAYSFRISSVSANALFNFFAASPVCEECASSIIIANLLFAESTSLQITGNFCNVVMIMPTPSLIASLSCPEFLSTFLTTPSTWSN